MQYHVAVEEKKFYNYLSGNKWMTKTEKNIFRQRAFKKYKNFESYYHQHIAPIIKDF